MTYYDKLNDFFDLLNNKNIAASTQLVYLHYLHFWNVARRGTAFYCSDRDVANSTNLSLRSVTVAKNVLKNLGLLNWKVIDGRTKIFLPVDDKYTPENTEDIQTVRDGVGISPAIKYSKTEKDKERGGASWKKFSHLSDEKFKVGVKLTPIEELREKYKPIPPEEKARVAERMKNMFSSFEMEKAFASGKKKSGYLPIEKPKTIEWRSPEYLLEQARAIAKEYDAERGLT